MNGPTTQSKAKSVTGAPYSFIGIIGNPVPRDRDTFKYACDGCKHDVWLDEESWAVRLALPTLCLVCINVLLLRRHDG